MKEGSTDSTRRDILKATGIGAVAATGLTGAVSARGKPSNAGNGNGGGACECPDGMWPVAKFENVDGDLVFEKTGMPVLDPSGEFSFSNVTLKSGEDDPEEIASFEWDSYPYAINHVAVKTGDGCFGVDLPNELPGASDGVDSGTDSGTVDIADLGTNKAISHVVFCAQPFWQIDIANTESPYEIGNPTAFIQGGSGTGFDCLRWLVGSPPGYLDGYSFGVDTDCDTATAAFDLTGVPPADGGEISVISAIEPAYGKLNSSNWQAVVDYQEIYDEDAVVYDSDDVGGTFSHTVTIPTA